jgi:carnitine O-palmitoyltransferase 2
MPKLPIPELSKTCDRWLKAVTPLMSESELQETAKAVNEFATSGAELQKILKERDAQNPDNSFINDYWKEMYLKEMRDALPLNVNPYLMFVDDARTSDPVIRAAALTESSMHFVKALREETLEPDIFHMGQTAQENWFKTLVNFVPQKFAYYAAYAAKSYPLDMAQYPWLFSTTRQAFPGKDVLYTDAQSRHIAVMHNNNVYAVEGLTAAGEPVPQQQLEQALRWIVQQKKTSPLGVGSLSILDRDTWAAARPKLVRDNEASLQALEGAIMLVCLDERPAVDAASKAAIFLHGRNDRFYDKSLQLIVSGDAKAAINFEHSWGDGVSVLRFANEIHEDCLKRPLATASQMDATAAAPTGTQVLPFDLKRVFQECSQADEWLRTQGEALTASELRIMGFGKSFFKSKKIAPDGTVQNAIQLAYRMAFGETVATYESASTAGFKKGRTETIRPATIESKAFVDAFMDSQSSKEQKKNLLHKAADAHRKNSTNAAIGQGMDRHLFALRRIAMEKSEELPKIFTDPSFSRMGHNVLSTSTLVSPALDGGGFGPVVADGFGIGYGTTDEGIAFVATTYRGKADMEKFLKALEEALNDIKQTLE